ncbi:hypothetical protein Ptr902_02590 [Pyrenophora tritici-repentis]|nr:hypothetical protein Ptr902_02590 [Pyrenophora tritici-repentis]
MRVPQPTATRYSPAIDPAYDDFADSDDDSVLSFPSSYDPAGPSNNRSSRLSNAVSAKGKLPKGKMESVETPNSPVMNAAFGFTDSDDDSVSGLPALIEFGGPSTQFSPIPFKSIFAKGGSLTDEMKRVDKAIHIAGLGDPAKNWTSSPGFDERLERFQVLSKSLCEAEFDKQRRGDIKGACDNSKTTEKSISSKKQDGASVKKGTSTKKKWSTVKLVPSVTLGLPVTHTEESATTAPSVDANATPKSKWTWVNGKGAMMSWVPDRVLAPADHVPLNTDSHAHSHRQYPTPTTQELCEMSEPVSFDEFQRRASGSQFSRGKHEHEDIYYRPKCIGGWNGCDGHPKCTCMGSGPTTGYDFTDEIPNPGHAEKPRKILYNTGLHPEDLVNLQASRKIDYFLEFTNNELICKEASLFLRMCGANVKVAVTMYHNFGGLESAKRVLAAWSSVPGNEKVVKGPKLRDYPFFESRLDTSSSDDDYSTVPDLESITHKSPVDDDRHDAVKSPEPKAPVLSTYTVTYWATIESGDESAHIPIESNNVTGAEKAIIEGNNGMKKVWKWVHEKGFIGKVGLQDAFDLAQDMHGRDEPAQVFDKDELMKFSDEDFYAKFSGVEDHGYFKKAKSRCGSERDGWGEPHEQGTCSNIPWPFVPPRSRSSVSSRSWSPPSPERCPIPKKCSVPKKSPVPWEGPWETHWATPVPSEPTLSGWDVRTGNFAAY